MLIPYCKHTYEITSAVTNIAGNISGCLGSNNWNSILLHLVAFQNILLVCICVVSLQNIKSVNYYMYTIFKNTF